MDNPPDLKYKRFQEHCEARNMLTDLVERLGHVFLEWELEMLVTMWGMQALLAEKIKQASQTEERPLTAIDEL